MNPSSVDTPPTQTRTRSRAAVGAVVATAIALGAGALVYYNAVIRIPNSLTDGEDLLTETFDAPTTFLEKDAHLVQEQGVLWLNTDSTPDTETSPIFTRPGDQNGAPATFDDLPLPTSICSYTSFSPEAFGLTADSVLVAERNGQSIAPNERVLIRVPVGEEPPHLHDLSEAQAEQLLFSTTIEKEPGGEPLLQPALRVESSAPQVAVVALVDHDNDEQTQEFVVQPVTSGETRVRISGCGFSLEFILEIDIDAGESNAFAYGNTTDFDTRYLDGWAISPIVSEELAIEGRVVNSMGIQVDLAPTMLGPEDAASGDRTPLRGLVEIVASNDNGQTWVRPARQTSWVIGDSPEETGDSHEIGFRFPEEGVDTDLLYAIRLVQDDNQVRFTDSPAPKYPCPALGRTVDDPRECPEDDEPDAIDQPGPDLGLFDARFNNPFLLPSERVSSSVIDLNDASSFDFFLSGFTDQADDVNTISWIVPDHGPLAQLAINPQQDGGDVGGFQNTALLSFEDESTGDVADVESPFTTLSPALPFDQRQAGLLSVNQFGSRVNGILTGTERMSLLVNPPTRVGIEKLTFDLKTDTPSTPEEPVEPDPEPTCEEERQERIDNGEDPNDIPLCDPIDDEEEQDTEDDPLLIDLRFQHRDYHRVIVGMTFGPGHEDACESPEGVTLTLIDETEGRETVEPVYFLADNPEGFTCYAVLRGLRGGQPEGTDGDGYENGRGQYRIKVSTATADSGSYTLETLNRTQSIQYSHCLTYGEMCGTYTTIEELDTYLEDPDTTRKDGLAFWVAPERENPDLTPVHPAGVRYAMMTDERFREFPERFFASVAAARNNLDVGIARTYRPIHDRLPDINYPDGVTRPCITGCFSDEAGVAFWRDQIETIDAIDRIDIPGYIYAAYISEEGESNYLDLASSSAQQQADDAVRCIPTANYAYLRALRRAADAPGARNIAEQVCGNYDSSAEELDVMIRDLAQSQEKRDRLDAVVETYKDTPNSCDGRVQAVSELYQSCFGRAPDVEGVNYWACSQTQLSVQDLNTQFCSAGEGQ